MVRQCVNRQREGGGVRGRAGAWPLPVARRLPGGPLQSRLCLLLTIVLHCLPLQSLHAAPRPDSYEDAVARVILYRDNKAIGTGTGFFVSPQGHLVTNHHVIDAKTDERRRSLQVWLANGGERLAAQVVWADQALDLAILQLASKKSPAFLTLEQPLVEKGTQIYAVGYPGVQDRDAGQAAVDSTITNGSVSRIYEAAWGGRKGGPTLKIIAHNANVNPGNSGGPLINDCSRVVGVNTTISLLDLSGRSRSASGPKPVEIRAFSQASHISEALRQLDKQNVPYEVATEACTVEPIVASPVMSSVNTIAIAVLAGLVLLLFFRQPRQAVMQGAQRTVAKIGSMTRVQVPGAGPASPAGGTDTPAQARVRLLPEGGGATPVSIDQVALQAARYGISFGRHAALVDRSLETGGLSRRHFRISQEQGSFFIEDLNSGNGTSVNGERLQPYFGRALREGDRIKAGDASWRFSHG